MEKKRTGITCGYGSFKEEDFALTPYIFIVFAKSEYGNYYGLGLA